MIRAISTRTEQHRPQQLLIGTITTTITGKEQVQLRLRLRVLVLPALIIMWMSHHMCTIHGYNTIIPTKIRIPKMNLYHRYRCNDTPTTITNTHHESHSLHFSRISSTSSCSSISLRRKAVLQSSNHGLFDITRPIRMCSKDRSNDTRQLYIIHRCSDFHLTNSVGRRHCRSPSTQQMLYTTSTSLSSSKETTTPIPTTTDINDLIEKTVYNTFMNDILLPIILESSTASSTTTTSISSLVKCKYQISTSSSTTTTILTSPSPSPSNSVVSNITLQQQSPPPSPSTHIMDCTIILGVSGGCDSIALLHLLHSLLIVQEKHCFHITQHPQQSHSTSNNIVLSFSVNIHWNIVVVHFDHQQRGNESDQDRILVQSLCQQLRVPCFIYKWNDDNDDVNNKNSNSSNHETNNTYDHQETTSPSTIQKRKFTQSIARQWRRNKMKQLLMQQIQERCEASCDCNHIGMIMTAHHKDDSNETLLLKLLRGVHLTNIAGLSTIQRTMSTDDNNDNKDYHDDNNDDSDYIPIRNHISSENTTGKVNSNNIIKTVYWVRPLLNVRKIDLIKYLQYNNYEWREDISNQSDKYLRNRIRNELIPLLQDLISVDDTNNNIDGIVGLEKRLYNIQQQSTEIRIDIQTRVDQYIHDHVKDGLFIFSSTLPFDLITKQALYYWIKQQMKNGTVSYEQIQRLYQQINNYPHKKKWQINIGQHWNIVRYGDTLRVLHDDNVNTSNNVEIRYDDTAFKVCKFIVHPNTNQSTQHLLPSNEGWIDICISHDVLLHVQSYQFVQTTWQAYQNQIPKYASNLSSLYFTPPWKDCTISRNPIRINDYLRGQKIPLHERPNTPLIVMIPSSIVTMDANSSSNNSNSITPSFNSELLHLNDNIQPTAVIVVAIYCINKKKWIVDRQFTKPIVDDTNNTTLHSNNDNTCMSILADQP
jgi:tRNA(Ile)-lysidine synthase TilS/MesJ